MWKLPRPASAPALIFAALVLAVQPGVASAEAVIVASTSPKGELGRVLKPGDRVIVPAGASVTVADSDGSVRYFTHNFAYRPAGKAPVPSAARRMVEAIGVLLRMDPAVMEDAAVRGDVCEEASDDLPALVDMGCMPAAMALLDAQIDSVTPFSLYVASERTGPFASDEPVKFEAMANRSARVTCRAGAGSRTVEVSTVVVASSPGALIFAAGALRPGRHAIVCEAQAQRPGAPLVANAAASVVVTP